MLRVGSTFLLLLVVLQSEPKPQFMWPTPNEYYIGDNCPIYNPYNRQTQTGICTPFHRCSHVQRHLYEGQRPFTCGYMGFEPIVCCPHGNYQQTTTPNPRRPIMQSEESIEDNECDERRPHQSGRCNTNRQTTPPPTRRPIMSTREDFEENCDDGRPHGPGRCTKQNQRIITTTETTVTVRKADDKCNVYHPKREGFFVMVVGGEQALSKEFPHMAIIGFGDLSDIQWLCGGTLISENFVLTAAHCLDSDDYGEARWVRLGDLDLKNTTDDARPQDFSVIRRIAHPEYRPPSQYNDIGLVELDRKATFDDYVKPACLYTSQVLNQTSVIATGWGRTSFAGETSAQLMKVDLEVTANDVCQRAYRNVPRRRLPQGIQGTTQICAAGEGKDTCQGDSGGPLQFKEFRLRWVQVVVGVTSFGKACGIGNQPGVYTRIAPYVTWIESIVWPN